MAYGKCTKCKKTYASPESFDSDKHECMRIARLVSKSLPPGHTYQQLKEAISKFKER